MDPRNPKSSQLYSLQALKSLPKGPAPKGEVEIESANEAVIRTELKKPGYSPIVRFCGELLDESVIPWALCFFCQAELPLSSPRHATLQVAGAPA